MQGLQGQCDLGGGWRPGRGVQGGMLLGQWVCGAGDAGLQAVCCWESFPVLSGMEGTPWVSFAGGAGYSLAGSAADLGLLRG